MLRVSGQWHATALIHARGELDAGVGAGRVTLMSLAESQAHVHAAEPAAARRPLMTRLAALAAASRRRVTVHPSMMDEFPPHAVADVSVCHDTAACLPMVRAGAPNRPGPGTRRVFVRRVAVPPSSA